MTVKNLSYCLNCEVQVLRQSKNTKRCAECPDRLDYILRLGGQQVHYRKDNPDKLGFRKLGLSSSPTTKQSVFNNITNTVKQNDNNITRQCKVCGKKFPITQIDKYFQKSAKSKDGRLKTCKDCMRQKLKKAQKKYRDKLIEKKRQQTLIPSNEAPPKPEPKSQPESIVERETKHVVKVCEKCGCSYANEEIEKNFSFHNSTTDGLYKKCKKCMMVKMSKTMKNVCSEKSKKTENIIKIDFNDYPEMLKRIYKLAKKDFRNVEQEILAILDCFLEENKDAGIR